MADGNFRAIAYDLERTNYLLAFGAGILESHKPLARNLRLWGKMRRERAIRARVVVIDPRYSVTASKADEWIPIHPGTDGALAMAIAHVILSEELQDKSFIQKWTAGFAEYAELAMRHYPPEKVASITGIESEQIRRVAREFAQTKPAMAWVGTGPSRWPNGSYNTYAIFCLNALVGSIDAPGGVLYQENPSYRGMPKVAQDGISQKGLKQARLDLGQTERFPAAEVVTNQVADSIRQGVPYPVEVALGWNCNFNMSAPGAGKWDEALMKVPYYVHMAPFPSEMAAYADILLPSSTFLEQWGYDHSPPGSGFAELRLKQPVVDPLPHSKAIGDVIFELARRQGGTVAQSFSNLGEDVRGFTRYRTDPLLPWKDFCERGVCVGPAYQYHKYERILKTPSKKFEFYSENLEKTFQARGKGTQERQSFLPHYEEVRFIGSPQEYPLVLLTYQPLLCMENGSQNYPWAQETFLVMHGVGWTNLVEVNNQTAKALGIQDGNMVWVESAVSRIKVRARVFEGIHPQVVSIARGQGHYAGGPWAKGRGVNPQEIIGVDYDRLSGQAAFSNTRVKIYKA
jgi:anaerobic selenocysteine-containing dehydrogenase